MATDRNQDDEYLPTRQSLLERLKDLDDRDSWNDFFETYWKLIYSVARRTGLSDVEAQDVVQETIISFSKKIQGFTYDPKHGSFKAWLKKLTQWRLTDFVRKKQYQVKGKRLPKDQPLETALAEQQESPELQEMERAWDEEWESHLMDLALQRVKGQVDAKQYQLFRFHVCRKFPAKEVAERFKTPVQAVYNAKYKVGDLVKEQIKLLEGELI